MAVSTLAEGAAGGTAQPADKPRSYHAFISYNQAADARLAPALQKALHRFAKPWWRMRALRVFRDKTSLAADPELEGALQRALADSEWFILLASPGAAQSRWVNQEVEWWLRERSPRRMLIALTEGELQWNADAKDFDPHHRSAAPPALIGTLATEPNIVDVRFAGAKGSDDVRSLRHAQFRAAILDLAAPIHGVAKDALDGEDVHQHRLTRWITGAAIAALIVLTGLAIWGAIEARRQATAATSGRMVAESRLLATRAQSLLDDGQRDAALLHAVEARRAMSAEVQQSTGEWFAWQTTLLAVLMDQGAPLDATLHGAGRAALSSDGKTLVTKLGNSVTVWDAQTRQRKLDYQAPFQVVFDVGLAPDGSKMFLTSQLTEEVLVVDTRTGKADAPRKIPGKGFTRIWSSPDGRRLAFTSYATLTVWDTATQQALPLRVPPSGEFIVGVWFDRTATRMIYGRRDGSITAMNLDSGQASAFPLKGRLGSLDAMALSPLGDRLVAAGDAGLSVWDARSGAQLWNDEQVAAIAEKQARSNEGVVTATRSATPDEARAEALAGRVRSIAVSPDGTMLATGDDKGTIKRWRLALDPSLQQRIGKPKEAHSSDIQSLTFSPDGKTLFSGADGSTLAWDVSRPHRLATVLPGPAPGGGRVSLSDLAAVDGGRAIRWPTVSNEQLLAMRLDASRGRVITASCAEAGTVDCRRLSIREWGVDGQPGGAERLLEQASAEFTKVTLGRSGQLVVAYQPGRASGGTAPDKALLWVWQAGASAPRQITLADSDSASLGLVVSEDERLIAVMDLEGAAFYRVQDGAALKPPVRAKQPAFDPSGKRMAVWEEVGSDYVVVVRNADTMEQQVVLQHKGPVMGTPMAWSADGQWLAIGGEDASLTLWEVRRQRRIGPPMHWDGREAEELAFTPDRKALLVRESGGRLLRFDLDPASWETLACRVANRNLSLEEWRAIKDDQCYRRTCPTLPPDPGLGTASARLERAGDAAGAAQVQSCLGRAPP